MNIQDKFYKTYFYAACRVTVQSGALSIIQFNITFPLGYIKNIAFPHLKKRVLHNFQYFLFNLIIYLFCYLDLQI